MRRWRDRATRKPPAHLTRREGDEIACSCGMRWPADEDHPPLAAQGKGE